MQGDKGDYLNFASISVGEGHSDKLCNQVSDGVLDAVLKVDQMRNEHRILNRNGKFHIFRVI